MGIEIEDWREAFSQSPTAEELERSLSPDVRRSPTGLKSTAYTDVKKRRITLDVSQPPLKCALSYAYELKNLENSEKFKEVIDLAKAGRITKANFVNRILHIEAEAIYFRCKVFYEIGANQEQFPCRQEYLDIYSSSRDRPEAETIERMAAYTKENGIVRREYPAKKYYSDSYDVYTGKKKWPAHYDEQRSNDTVIARDQMKAELNKIKGDEPTDNQDEQENATPNQRNIR